MSVRIRILAAVLMTSALAMVLAGSVSFAMTRWEVDQQIAASLAQEVEEFRAHARISTDPTNGVVIKSPRDILRYAIGSTYPDDNEAVMALVNGEVTLVPARSTPLQESLIDDPDFVAQAADVRPEETVIIRHASTPLHPDVLYISIPTQIEGQPDIGHYVVAVDRTVPLREVHRNFVVFALAGLVILLLMGAVGNAVAGRLLAPLRSLRATAQRISEADLSERIPDDQLESRDEVADLGRVMNQMLDRLSVSFDTQRRLLDDAGHELRTPITIVQGHLELVNPDQPDDVRETRALVLDELDRMRRLVDDLLILAKSKRPDFVVPAPTDLDVLVTDVLERVTTLGRRAWKIEEAEPGVIMVDQQRIIQAMIQLVANAVKFTEDGDVIAMGGRVEADSVRLWVRDEGKGISVEDQQTIFSRFERGQNAEGSEGAGLGLSIVSVIAESHNGRVEVASIPGAGAMFTLILPHDVEESPWQPS